MQRRALAFAAAILVLAIGGLWWFLASEPDASYAAWERSIEPGETVHASTLVAADVARGSASGSESAAREALRADEPISDEQSRARDAESGRNRIVGRVVDATGAPIAGADMWASSSSIWESLQWSSLPLDIETEALPRMPLKIARATTDADGRYAFEDLESGALRVVARAHGRVPKRPAPFTVPAGYREFQVPDLVMAAARAVTGRVVDESGEGVEGARVALAIGGAVNRGSTVVGRGVVVAASDVDGGFFADEIAPGEYELIVDAPGYCVATHKGLTGNADGEGAPVLIQLARGVEIHGVVRGLDAARNKLLRISARRAVDEREGRRRIPSPEEVRAREARCDEEGRFAIKGLADGVQYRLTAWTRPDEQQEWKRLDGADAPVVRAGEVHAEIVYTALASMRFRVVDAGTRTPLETFTVWAGVGRETLLRNERNEARRLHPGGAVRLADLRTRVGGKPVELRISAPGYVDHIDKDVDVLPGADLDLGDIALARSPVVRAHVVAADTGEPIAGARVWMTTRTLAEIAGSLRHYAERDMFGDPSLRFERTDAGGDATLSMFLDRPALISAAATGFSPSEPLSITPTSEGDLAHTIRLERSGTLIVHVTDAEHSALADVTVHCRSPKPHWQTHEREMQSSAQTDAHGDARFENVYPGACSLRVHELFEDWDAEGDEEGVGAGWIDAQSVAGAVTRVALTARSRGTVRGRVSEGGVPLANAHLRVIDMIVLKTGDVAERDWASSENPFAAVADGDGRYTYENLACGSYAVFVGHPARRMAARFDLVVEPGTSEVDFDLDSAGIEGRVSDSDGKPIADAEVRVSRANPPDDPGQPFEMILHEDERGQPQTRYVPVGRAFETTDRQGRFAIHGVATGEDLVLDVRAEGYELKKSDKIVVATNEVRRGVDFSLRTAGCIAVALTSDSPPAGANARDRWFDVRAQRVENGERETAGSVVISLSKAKGKICSLAPGNYQLVCRPRGKGGSGTGAAISLEVEVASGATTNAAFHVP